MSELQVLIAKDPEAAQWLIGVRFGNGPVKVADATLTKWGAERTARRIAKRHHRRPTANERTWERVA